VPGPDRIVLGRVVVIGTGLIGTSVALAMSARGTTVLLTDRDPAAAALAAELGAGEVLGGSADRPADLAILAVPPPAVALTLRNAQERGVARVYTDVASVKAGPLAEAAELGCDMPVFVGGHPMAGGERSGPAAARADLFLGRPWVLCPSDQSDARAIETVSALVRACGAVPLTVDAAEHDRAVALVSHAPHVVSSAMAARFGDAADSVLGLAGQGVRDVTRIAAGDPQLWLGILSANAGPVAEVIEDVSNDLALTASALREQSARGKPGAVDACGDVTDLLLRGKKGRTRITG
jgi:prephenate dehydrogenase